MSSPPSSSLSQLASRGIFQCFEWISVLLLDCTAALISVAPYLTTTSFVCAGAAWMVGIMAASRKLFTLAAVQAARETWCFACGSTDRGYWLFLLTIFQQWSHGFEKTNKPNTQGTKNPVGLYWNAVCQDPEFCSWCCSWLAVQPPCASISHLSNGNHDSNRAPRGIVRCNSPCEILTHMVCKELL